MSVIEIIAELNYIAIFMLGLMVAGQLAKSQKTAYNWMQILLYVVMDVILFAGWNTKPDLTYRYPGLALIDMPFLFASGPALYLLFAVIHGDKPRKKTWLHFLPSISAGVVFAFYLRTPIDEKNHQLTRALVQGDVTFYEAYFGLGVVVTVIYLLKLLFDYRNLFTPSLIRADRYVLLIVSLLVMSALAAFSALSGLIFHNFMFFRISVLLIALGLHIFFVASFRSPDLHNALTILSRQKKSSKAHLSEEKARSIDEKIRKLFEIEKIHTQESLSLASLAESLDISMYQLSEFLNTWLQKSFYDFLHEYRVRDAEAKLRKNGESILNIAFSVGFNSKASFNRIFKKITGITPGEYRVLYREHDANTMGRLIEFQNIKK